MSPSSSSRSSPKHSPSRPSSSKCSSRITLDTNFSSASSSQPSSPSDVRYSMPGATPSPSSPRGVHFPAAPVTGSTRTPKPLELGSMTYFETHAKACPDCNLPYDSYKVNRRLCLVGYNLADDLLRHVYRRDHHYFSMSDTSHLVHVEIDKEYRNVRQVLKLVEKYGRSAIIPASPLPTYNHGHGKSTKKHDDHHHRHHHHARNDSANYVYYTPVHPDPYAGYSYQPVDYTPSYPTYIQTDRHGRSPTRPDHYGPRDASTAATVGSREGYNVRDFIPSSSSSKKHRKSGSR